MRRRAMTCLGPDMLSDVRLFRRRPRESGDPDWEIVEILTSSLPCPDAILYHYESASRGSDVLAKFKNPLRYRQFKKEQRALLDKWSSEIDSDPNYDAKFVRKKNAKPKSQVSRA